MNPKTTIIKKDQSRILIEKKFTCPYCARVVTMPEGRIIVRCDCGNSVFRPLPNYANLGKGMS